MVEILIAVGGLIAAAMMSGSFGPLVAKLVASVPTVLVGEMA